MCYLLSVSPAREKFCYRSTDANLENTLKKAAYDPNQCPAAARSTCTNWG